MIISQTTKYLLLCCLQLMTFDMRDSEEQHVWLYDKDMEGLQVGYDGIQKCYTLFSWN